MWSVSVLRLQYAPTAQSRNGMLAAGRRCCSGYVAFRAQFSAKKNRHLPALCAPPSHVDTQRQIFDAKVTEFEQPLPEAVQKKLARIVGDAQVKPGDRVIDVGAGVHTSFRTWQAANVKDTMSVDLFPAI